MKAAKQFVQTAPTTATPSAQPFFAKNGSATLAAKAPAEPLFAPQIQTKLSVGRADDAFEHEADATADKIVAMPAPAPAPLSPAAAPGSGIQAKAAEAPDPKPLKKEEEKERLRKKEDGPIPTVRLKAADEKEKLRKKSETTATEAPSGFESQLSASQSGGSAMSAETRGYMEPRFASDFSGVKIHTDGAAVQMSKSVGAQAFTYQNHIYFNEGKYQPSAPEGRRLLAHELTHVLQQGGAVQRKPVVGTTAPPSVQRGLFDSIGNAVSSAVSAVGSVVSGAVDIVGRVLNFFAERAYIIPGFRMLSIVIGRNPINMRAEPRNAANILRAAVEFMPGGFIITQVLDRHGVFDRAGAWVEQQINSLGMTVDAIREAIMTFVRSLSLSDITNLGGVWERAQRIVLAPINRIRTFVGGLITGILGFIREAVLRPLAEMARGTRGYDLLRAVLGRDPVTGEEVPRNAETLIGGFMRLIGQEEVWQNIQRGNAIGRAWTWFQSALAELGAFVRAIPPLIVSTLQSLTVMDFLTIVGVFTRIGRAFGSFVGQFISWAGSKVMGLLEILFSVVAPGVMPFIRRAAGTFQRILQDPIGFVGNLVRAGLQGFRQFGTNILRHLQTGLVGWLTGALGGAGLQLPQQWDFRGILSLVLQILGLTWQNIRTKLVRVLGERPVAVLETTFSLVMTLVREGPAAAWQELMQHLGNLRDMVFGQIREWVIRTVVTQAITRIATMLNPAGAVIQAIIAIYNTIMFFVERMRQIWAVVESVVNSLEQIASGAIGQAANYVEQTMARFVPVLISFLARLLGLGGISQTIQNIIGRIRAPIDRALDRVVDWIVRQARRLASAGRNAVGAVMGWLGLRKQFRARGGNHSVYFSGNEENPRLMVASEAQPYEAFIQTITVNASQTTVKNEAMGIARRIDEQIRNRSTRSAVDASAISQSLQLLSEKTAILMDNSEIPPSIIEFGGLNSEGGAQFANARRLSTRFVAGSTPRDNAAIWIKANRRRPASAFVQGHLLNHHIGGPGLAFNLTPITGNGAGLGSAYANRVHLDQVETHVKREVLVNKNIVRYKVTAVYSAHPVRSFQQTLQQRIGTPNERPQDQRKLEIMNYEQNHLARALTTDWAKLKKTGNDWVDDEHMPPLSVVNNLPDGDFEIQD